MPATQTDRLNGLTTSVAVKAPCKAVSTVALTLSGEQTVNGVACVAGDRVLYALAGGSVDNGIWVVSIGAWSRAKDFDGNRDVVTGTIVGVIGNAFYEVTTTGDLVIGTTAIEFAPSVAGGNLATQLASTSNASHGAGLSGFNQLLAYALGTVGRRLRDFGYLVNVPAGGADATSAINAVILAAHQAKSNVLSQDETYSVVIRFEWGKDYTVAGPILLPAGIVLDLCGSRLVGTFASGISTAYADGSASVIETGYYSAGAITTNRSAGSTAQRVVGAGVMNGTIINANCGLNLINFHERSFVENMNFSNVSAAIRLKSCYYSRLKRVVVRNSSQAANQYALLMHGVDCSAMRFEAVTVVDAVRGLQCDSNPSSGVVIDNCSFEGAYVTNSAGTVDGTGIYFGATSAMNGWEIRSSYFESIRWGMKWIAGAAAYGLVVSGNFFTNTEYAALGATSSVRVGNWYGNSHPDGGGIIRNLVDFSSAGNEVEVDIQDKVGSSPTSTSAFLTNVLLGNRGSADAHSFWDDTAVAGGLIASATGARANLAALASLPWEGAQMVTKNLQVPFCVQTIAATTITLDTQLTYDLSNMLCCHMVISDFAGGPYTFDCLIFGATVYPLAAFSGGKGITVSNNAGNVRVVFTGLNTNSGASYAIQGGVRHL